MSAEDFSFMLEYTGGYYLMIGPCTLHNPSFDFNDALIPIGAAVWVRLAQARLAQEKA